MRPLTPSSKASTSSPCRIKPRSARKQASRSRGATAACLGAGPYRVPNARIHAVGAYTNNPPAGAMRGFGAVQSCFAYEAQMDALAAKLGISPLALRERNALRNGDAIVTGQPVEG